jgi:hypothetical protein
LTPKVTGFPSAFHTIAGTVELIQIEVPALPADRFTVALCELPLNVAVTVAAWLLVMLLVVALKVADVRPAVTVTEAGTVSTVLVFVSVTTAPPLGATFVSVTVQVPEAFGPKLAGHASDDTSTGATRLTVAFAELALYVAVTVAL